MYIYTYTFTLYYFYTQILRERWICNKYPLLKSKKLTYIVLEFQSVKRMFRFIKTFTYPKVILQTKLFI